MRLLVALVLLSSLSFLGYGVAYFVSPHMKREFERFGLGRVGLVAIVFELLGATGLLVGLRSHPILLVSAGGLALLMLLGVATRIWVRDSLRLMLPALFYLLLNTYIFAEALSGAGGQPTPERQDAPPTQANLNNAQTQEQAATHP